MIKKTLEIVKLRELEGQIKAEELNGQLLQVKKKYIREEATADGECDADRITNFMNNLPENLSKEERMAIYYDMQNTERVKSVTSSKTTLYITPQDLDFKITNINYQNSNNNPNNNRNVEILPISDD